MPTDLEILIELARKHEMSPSERDAQLRSFAYGNTHFENESITHKDIDDAVATLTAAEKSMNT
jgi:hypothetical protein